MAFTPLGSGGVAAEEIPGAPLFQEPQTEPCALVIFGITGDLAKRKLIPALYELHVDGRLPDPFAVVGVSRSPVSADRICGEFRDSVHQHGRRKKIDHGQWGQFAACIEFVSGQVDDPATYGRLKAQLSALDKTKKGVGQNRIFYLATPPDAFPVIIEHLRQGGLIHRTKPGAKAPFSRVIIEKPFGKDLESARALNGLVAESLDESQTFRIDHYLGKETVQNILVFRFANSIFEPIWNRKYIDHVEITAAETIGVEKRGSFYDRTGIVRDIVQNHLLQLLALSAAEPPISLLADDMRNTKVDVLRSLRPLAGPDIARQVVLGQYDGYRKEPDVAPDSRAPTFVAMKVLVDNWRWQGVPFYLRAGKKLAAQVTEISIHFQHVPDYLFPRPARCQKIQTNVLRLRIQPEEGISLRFVTKVPGDQLLVGNVLMEMSYASTFGKPLSDAYERLLLDCLRGDATLFARRDEIEEAWRFVTPILEAAEKGNMAPAVYPRGSEGPKEAEELLAKDGKKFTKL